MIRNTLIFTLVPVILASSAHGAAAENQTEAVMKRMRDTLKNVMQQLQTAQNEKAALQTTLAEAEQKNKDLTSELEAMKKKFDSALKQSAAEKAAADKNASELNAKIANRESELAQTVDALNKWKSHDRQAVDLLNKKEAERARLASKAIVLERVVAERERQNLELYKTGSEILTRYENFGLGKALLAREPFVGTARVKLETQVQDYRDKLTDSKAKPGSKPAATAARPSDRPAPAAAAKKD